MERTQSHAKKLSISTLAGAVLGAALALGGCAESKPGPAAATPPAAREDADFDSTLALLEAVEEDRLAERVDLQEMFPQPEPPPTARIDFVSGTRVPEEEYGELRELASVLSGNPRLRVDLIGCSDPSGSAALNRRISRKRAESVAELLRQLRVPDARFGTIEGRGEDCEQQVRAVFAEPYFAQPDVAQQDAGEDA